MESLNALNLSQGQEMNPHFQIIAYISSPNNSLFQCYSKTYLSGEADICNVKQTYTPIPQHALQCPSQM